MEHAYAVMPEDASGRKPPFFRFCLYRIRFGVFRMEYSSFYNPSFCTPSLYVGMERVPIESWVAFWSRIELILRNGYRIYCIIEVVEFALWVAYLVFAHTKAENRAFVCFLFLVFIRLFVWSGRTRQAQLRAIRTVCRDEEERVFRSYGFALECDCEWGMINLLIGPDTSDLSIYFLPYNGNTTLDADDSDHAMKNHGYVRIELFNTSPYACTWTPISLASLASYSSLPTEFESLDNDIWTGFWSEMCAVSRECLVAYRLLWAIFGIPFALLLTLTLTLSDGYDALAFLALLLLLLVSQFPNLYSWYRFQPAMERRRLLVEEYADRFARQGVYMEYRRSYKSHLCTGLYRCHYLYLFPTQTTAALMP